MGVEMPCSDCAIFQRAFETTRNRIFNGTMDALEAFSTGSRDGAFLEIVSGTLCVSMLFDLFVPMADRLDLMLFFQCVIKEARAETFYQRPSFQAQLLSLSRKQYVVSWIRIQISGVLKRADLLSPITSFQRQVASISCSGYLR